MAVTEGRFCPDCRLTFISLWCAGTMTRNLRKTAEDLTPVIEIDRHLYSLALRELRTQ